ncbi:MAG: hypothetical protein ACLRRT_05235 [Ruthenibacterium lactatiformans]
MNISPAIIIDVALIAVIVVSVFHYARKGFVAGLMDLVGNLASLALAWVVSGKLSPTVFENFFKSGLIEQTARTIQQQGGVNLSVILDGLSGILPQKFIDDITASAAGMLDSGAPDIAQQVVEKIIARWWCRSSPWWCFLPRLCCAVSSLHSLSLCSPISIRYRFWAA